MPLDGEIKKSLALKVEEADLALVLNKRSKNDVQWANANIELADALSALAEAEDDDQIALKHYHEAEIAYSNALQVFTKARDFARWGGVIVSYSIVLRAFGLRENSAKTQSRLQKSLSYLQQLYKALPKIEGAFDRGLVSFESGHTYRALAETDFEHNKIHHIMKACEAFHDAVQTMRLKENFKYWALALSAEALALADLARLQKNDVALKFFNQSIESFESVLEFYEARERPKDWSYLQFELGRACIHSAMWETPEQRYLKLIKALKAFQAAKSVISSVNNDIILVRLQNEMAMTLSLLSQHKGDKNVGRDERLKQAVELYRNNLHILNQSQNQDEIAIATIQGNLGKDLTMLANLAVSDEDSLKLRFEAIEALRAANTDILRNARPNDWLAYFIELGVALEAAASLQSQEQRIKAWLEANQIYSTAISTLSDKEHRDIWIKLHQWRATTYSNLGENDETEAGLLLLKNAELDYRLIYPHLDRKKNRDEYLNVQKNLGHLLFSMARRSESDDPIALLEAAKTSMEDVIALLKDHQATNEWAGAMAHYALILWRLASFGGFIEYFEKSECVFLKTLESSILQEKLFNFATVKSNYALMLKDWSEVSKYSTARIYLIKAQTLLSEALDLIDDNDNDTHDADYEEQIIAELHDINTQLKAKSFKRLFNFWPFQR